MRFAKSLLLICLITLSSVKPASAHEITPALIDLSVIEGQLVLSMTMNLEAVMSRLGSEHADRDANPKSIEYFRLRALSNQALRQEFNAFWPRLRSEMVARGAAPLSLYVASVIIPPTGDLDLPRESRLVLMAPLTQSDTSLIWAWSPDFGAAIVRQRLEQGGVGYSAYLTGGSPTDPIAIAQSNTWWKIW